MLKLEENWRNWFRNRTYREGNFFDGILFVAEAAAQHAGNANSTIMRGLEALGACLFSVAENTDCPLKSEHLQNMAALIEHLAVEAQFMQETQRGIEQALREDKARTLAASAGKGGK